MNMYSQKSGKFIRRSLEGKTNRISQDPMLSKIEDRLGSLGIYIKERYGMQTYNDILNQVFSTKL